MAAASSFSALGDLVPHGVLLLGALACMVVAVVTPRTRSDLPRLVAGAALLVAGVVPFAYLRGMPPDGYTAFAGGLVLDRYAAFLIPTLCAIGLGAVLVGGAVRHRVRPHAAEYHALLLLATLGAVLLAGAREVATLFVASQVLWVCLAGLVAIEKVDTRGAAAAARLLVLGGAGGALMLFGLTVLTGLSGSTDLAAVAAAVPHAGPAAALGVALTLVGMCVSLGAPPFHRWRADVADHAAAPVAGLATTLAVTAGFAAFARVAVVAVPAVSSNWEALVAAVSVAATAVGGLGALGEVRVRRVAALLGLSQAGVLLCGLLGHSPGQQGVGAMLFGLFTSAVATVGVFAVVTAVESGAGTTTLAGWRGLARRSPGSALVMSAGLLSLAGAPPLVGFFTRLFCLEAAAAAGWAWLVLLTALGSVLALVAALRVVGALYAQDPVDDTPEAVLSGPGLRAVVAVCGLATVFLGAAAQPLLALATGGGGRLH